MITYVQFNNFYSYLDTTQFSFNIGEQATSSDYYFNTTTSQDTYRLNKVMAVVGANGSGKTQLLKALAFLRFFICGSMERLDKDEEIPFNKFVLSESEVSDFELGFLIKNLEGVLDEYRYNLTLSKNKVVKESLHKKTSRQFSYVFVREYDVDNQLIYRYRDFIVPSLANEVKRNASMISYANLLDYPLAETIIEMFDQCKTNVSAMGRTSSMGQSLLSMTELFSKDEDLKQTAESLLCQFDTGIDRINIRKVLVLNDDDKKSKEVDMPFGVHKIGDEEFELIFYEESNGTQSAFSLLGLILPVLKIGGVAIIDELDNDLHPHLLPAIFELFRSSYHNPHNAQLIFSCHTPEVFNLLNKHQIYLVEKVEQVSEAWRLDEVKGVRNDDNLYAKYMAGAFDAIPNLY